jgi:methyltransferase of ATP-grasp peptide maturase system
MTVDETALLRAALVTELTDHGWLRTAPWMDAFRSVPRHVFLPRYFRLTPDGRRYEAIDADHPAWLDTIYSNSVATTQLDSDDTLWDQARRNGPIEGTPTSSSTQPSLMATMLEALEVQDGHRMLEVGTGTGYNAALLAHRLGANAVASVEYDSSVAQRARQALTAAGYNPTVIVADGSTGCPARAPYDRLIATYSVTAIPPAWLAQLRPGGLLVTSLYRDLNAGLLVRLTVTDRGTGVGRLLDDSAYFMPTRSQPSTNTAALVRAASHQDGETRSSELPGPVTDDASGWTALAALMLPDVARLDIQRDDGQVQWLVHPDGSWAYYQASDRLVEQSGPRHLWDELEAAHARWQSLGAPARDRLGITVHPNGHHRVWIDEERNNITPQPIRA